MIAVIFSEVFLYLCFSFLFGYLILNIVPKAKRPKVLIPKTTILTCVIGIIVFSFLPVLNIVYLFQEGIGFWVTMKSVLTQFEIGKAWLLTLGVSLFLFFLIRLNDISEKKNLTYLALAYTLVLVISLGWASHAATQSLWKGLFIHSTHFLAICIWTGILVTVGWFARSTGNWKAFLSWFTPTAFTCVVVAITSGIFLMLVVVDFKDYVTSWILSYGQSLLIKHLLIVAVLSFAIINGILVRTRLKNNPDFNPIPWLRTESIIVFLVFSATAALGQQIPPHDVSEQLRLGAEPSLLFSMFYNGVIEPGNSLSVAFDTLNGVLLILSFLFIGLTLLSFVKKAPPLFSLTMSVMFVITSYISLMLGVH